MAKHDLEMNKHLFELRQKLATSAHSEKFRPITVKELLEREIQ